MRESAPERGVPPGRAGLGRALVGGAGARRSPTNVAMTVNLLEAVRARGARGRRSCWSARARSTGRPSGCRWTRSAPLRPQNPYAVSKAACDLLGGQYADAHGLRVVRAARRSTTPARARRDDYVVGTLTRQVAEAEAAGARRRRCCAPATPTRRATSRTCATWRAPTSRPPTLDAGRLQRRQRPGRERARADRAGARGGAHPGAPRGRPGARARPRRARGARVAGAAPRGHRLGAGDPARADGGRRARRAGGAGVPRASAASQAPLQLLEHPHHPHARARRRSAARRRRARTRRSGGTRSAAAPRSGRCGDQTSPERAMYSP